MTVGGFWCGGFIRTFKYIPGYWKSVVKLYNRYGSLESWIGDWARNSANATIEYQLYENA
jgi:hypothetical protein